MRLAFLTAVIALAGSVALADVAATSALNALRAGKGRVAIVYSPLLEQVAAAHASDMARKGFFSHTGSNGSSVGQRMKARGYPWCFAAENIAQGQRSLDDVMRSWTSSSAHLRNMLHRKAREFGLARGSGNTWVMVLAARC